MEYPPVSFDYRTQSEDIAILMGAFCEASKEFKPVIKSGMSDRGPYATLDDYGDATKSALENQGLKFFFYRTPFGEGMMLRARLQHSGGQFFESATRAPHKENPTGREAGDTQGTFSRLQRYMMKELLGIMDEEDSAAQSKSPQQSQKLTGKISESQLNYLKTLIGSNEEVKAGFLRTAQVQTLADLSRQEASDFINQLKN